MSHLLKIDNLSVRFDTPQGVVRATERVSFFVNPGESLGLVGESGCGKSVTALSIPGLIPSPPGRISSGSIFFGQKDLLRLDAEALRQVRGREISMIFQEPMTSLNPVLPIGRQVAEPLMVHKGLGRKEAWDEAASWLDRAGIPAARRRLDDYPHQLSGGMRQRVMIAMAMVCRPRLLIADEPTTSLDVSIQSQILALMEALKDGLGMSILLISHDLAVVARMAARVVVMYAGQVMEVAGVGPLFEAPFHPYTRGLLHAIPRPGVRKHRLSEIPGTVPSLTGTFQGCRFADRCPHAFEVCKRRLPDLAVVGPGHTARCWLTEYPEHRRRHDRG